MAWLALVVLGVLSIGVVVSFASSLFGILAGLAMWAWKAARGE